MLSLPEELAIDPGEDAPPFEGEEDRGNQSVNPIIPRKRPVDTSKDLIGPRKTRGIQVDYRYLNNPFPDKEEAGIVEVREEVFAVVLDNDCHSLREAKASLEWPERMGRHHICQAQPAPQDGDLETWRQTCRHHTHCK